MQRISCIFWLGLKEMMSLRRDWVMMALLAWSFTLAPVMEATGVATSVNNASIAFADEDNSPLSRTLAAAFFPPEFQPVVQIEPGTGAARMDAGHFLFVVAVPPGFEKGVRAGRVPEIQVLIDATAMEQAGIGANYITSILSTEIRRFAIGADLAAPQTLEIIIRSAFNPNRDTVRFAGINALIGQIMKAAKVVTAAATGLGSAGASPYSLVSISAIHFSGLPATERTAPSSTLPLRPRSWKIWRNSSRSPSGYWRIWRSSTA